VDGAARSRGEPAPHPQRHPQAAVICFASAQPNPGSTRGVDDLFE
jgi:hypothetical protein